MREQRLGALKDGLWLMVEQGSEAKSEVSHAQGELFLTTFQKILVRTVSPLLPVGQRREWATVGVDRCFDGRSKAYFDGIAR